MELRLHEYIRHHIFKIRDVTMYLNIGQQNVTHTAGHKSVHFFFVVDFQEG